MATIDRTQHPSYPHPAFESDSGKIRGGCTMHHACIGCAHGGASQEWADHGRNTEKGRWKGWWLAGYGPPAAQVQRLREDRLSFLLEQRKLVFD